MADKFEDFEPLREAEKRLLEQVKEGKRCELGQTPPDTCTPYNEVRARFIRFLALGGDKDRAPVHERGIWLYGAWVSGALDLEGCDNVRPLWLKHCTMNKIYIFDARLRTLTLSGSRVNGTIRADRAHLEGSLLLRQNFCCESAVRMPGVTIRGDLDMNTATVSGGTRESQSGEHVALDLSTARIGGSVRLGEGFRATGVVRFNDAQIDGVFDCEGGHFEAKPGRKGFDELYALDCARLQVGGSVWLNKECTCEGMVLFTGARIGGDFDCRGGVFRRPSADGEWPYTLHLGRIQIGGDVFFNTGFKATGRVQLGGAHITGNLRCDGGVFDVSGLAAKPSAPRIKGVPIAPDALSLVNARIEGAFHLAPDRRGASDIDTGRIAKICGSLDLKNAHVTAFVDHPDCWPQSNTNNSGKATYNAIFLDGFGYERLYGGAPTGADLRLRWLKNQPPAHLGEDFRAQPFEQLVKVLRAMGHTESARKIAYHQQRYLRRTRALNRYSDPDRSWLYRWIARPVLIAIRRLIRLAEIFFLGVLTGYGYRLWRLAVVVTIVWLACAGFFFFASRGGVFAPRDTDLVLNDRFASCRETGWTHCDIKIKGAASPDRGEFDEYTAFNALIYSADLIVPVVDLGQAADWGPMVRGFKVTLPLCHYLSAVKDLPFAGYLPEAKAMPILSSLSCQDTAAVAEAGDAETIPVPAGFTRFVVWFEIAFGWLAGFLLVAGLSGLVKKD